VTRGGETLGDAWDDEGFGGENDWDEGEEALEPKREDGFPDPEELDDEDSRDDETDAE
jgi:hypothetical protein